jgi:hypothetical protein
VTEEALMARAVLIVAALAALVVAVPATASRNATKNERAAIARAVYSSAVGGINKVPNSYYRVTGQKVSTVSRSWALAKTAARPKYANSFQNASAVLVRPAGTSRWVVVDLGSSGVGCGIAPTSVLADLFNTKTPCPSGQGIP